MLNKFVIAYIDNILIYFTNHEQHISHARTVLQCLTDRSLYVKLEKCEFHRFSIVVEVDASSCGIGAMLSQRQPESKKRNPCAFFSRKLMPAERNYNVGNRELLSIKTALEEWRHWVEGAGHPFLVLTEHRYLAYLQEAKPLNTRQARWALFFTWFQFLVSYRLSSKNGKADALSRIHTSPELPSSIQVAPMQWDLMKDIKRAQST